MQTLPIIPAAFIFNCALVLWFVTLAKGPWFLKVAMLFVTGLLGFGIWQSLDSYLGYPKVTTMAKLHGQETVLLWVWVDEPDNVTGDKGAVYLWTLPPASQTQVLMRGPSPDPEAIKLPYDKGLHLAAQDLMGQILAQDGLPLPIKFGDEQKQSPDAQGKGTGGRAGATGSDMTGSMSIGEGKMYSLPKPKSPPKPQH